MSRRNKVIRNFILLAFLIVIGTTIFGLSFTPLSAHRHAERSFHYGPSEVVHTIDFDGGKYYLCKYDKWFSCDTVQRSLFFLWLGENPTGTENDISKSVVYTWSQTQQYGRIYGIANDDRIKSITFTLGDGHNISVNEFYDGMFLYIRKSDHVQGFDIKALNAYDEEGDVIYSEDYRRK